VITGSSGPREPVTAQGATEARAEAALERLPPRLSDASHWLLARWPGRILVHTAAACMRVDLFDRAMTIAAQFFTSVLPILILTATWAASRDADAIVDALGVPEQSRSIIEQAVQGADSAAFGIAGTLFLLVSATSLSRALTRAFAAIWDMPRPKSNLASAWRWVAVVLVLAIALVLVHTLVDRLSVLPPRHMWPVAVSLSCDLAVALFVPWVLLSGTVAPRLLLPGALAFALLMLTVRPASAAWLPRALEVSADRYGPIGVAFTYLAWLYVAAFCFMTTAVIGQVVATDRGRLGAWIRGTRPPSGSEGADDAR
jgi:membrane protein